MKLAKLPKTSDSTLVVYKNDCLAELNENVVRKTCQEIETYLRLDYHSNLQIEKYNPFLSTEVYYSMKLLAKMKSMKLFGKEVLLRGKCSPPLLVTQTLMLVFFLFFKIILSSTLAPLTTT